MLKGKAENRPGELVRVIVYSDHFSNRETTLASAYTDEKGSFSLELDVSKTSIARLAVGLKRGEFYLKPGGNYKVTIPMEEQVQRTSVFDELPLDFSLMASDDSLNEHIASYNFDYNTFLINNSNKIGRSNDKSYITTFLTEMENKYGKNDDRFFADYRRYSAASLEWLGRNKTGQEILEEYYVDQPILYANIQYAEFFKEFIHNYFAGNKTFTYSELVGAINSGRGFIEIDRLIMRDEVLKEDAFLRELIGILLVSKKFYNPDVRRTNVLSLLNEIARNSKSNANELIAANMIFRLRNLSYGSRAPGFKLKDSEGNDVLLSDFNDRFLLLYFARDDCKLCLYYFQDLDRLRKEFMGKMEVVTITTHEGFVETTRYAEGRAYDWPILDLGKDILLLESYNIRTYPSLVLVNPYGTVASVNVPMPQEGLELYIRRYIDRFEKQNRSSTRD